MKIIQLHHAGEHFYPYRHCGIPGKNWDVDEVPEEYKHLINEEVLKAREEDVKRLGPKPEK